MSVVSTKYSADNLSVGFCDKKQAVVASELAIDGGGGIIVPSRIGEYRLPERDDLSAVMCFVVADYHGASPGVSRE
jgi:hypothetical protein